MATTEAERLRLNRQFFEEGCLCILEAKTISPCNDHLHPGIYHHQIAHRRTPGRRRLVGRVATR